jgi:3-deoxy-manno-octulosonate cytidylyltransferase (CMP-KDO synthetase)
MTTARLVAVIPARMASSRLPGKPLRDVCGLPMVEHVRRRALLSGAFDEVVVATCDTMIAEVVQASGGHVVMTSESHASATDRVVEAAEAFDSTHIVNLQGDELLVRPGDLVHVAQAVRAEPEAPAWNAVAPIENVGELRDLSIVKLMVSTSGRVLFGLRQCAWFDALGPSFEPVRKSIGVMAYTRACLAQYARLPRTPLETADGIDQLRWLEHDMGLASVLLERGYPSINELRDVDAVTRILLDNPEQRMILEQARRVCRDPLCT